MDDLATRGRATWAETALHVITSSLGGITGASLICEHLPEGWMVPRAPRLCLVFLPAQAKCRGAAGPPERSREEAKLTVRLLVQAISRLYARAG